MFTSSLVDLHKYLGNPHKVLNFFHLNFVQMLHFLKPRPTNVKKLPFSASEERVHLIIGYTAFFLPVVLWGMTFADFACFPASISHFYYIPIAGDLFVGALIFIGMCMLCVYRVDGPRQHMTLDVILTRIAEISAICVAIFPTRGSGCVLNGETLRPFLSNVQSGLDLVQSLPTSTQLHTPCETTTMHSQAVGGTKFVLQGCLHTDLTAHLGVSSPFWNNFHYIAAAVLFAILFYCALFVFRRVQIEQDVINGQIGPHKRRRNRVYFGCAMCITLAMMAIGGATVSEWYLGSLAPWWEAYRLTFLFEAIGLMAFGLAWLVKGRFVPWLIP